MSESRTKNSIKNIFYSYLAQVVTILLKFLVRTYFVKVLTTEYLGLNGLFGNILTFLSFAELGIGGAITYNLYVEIAKNNTIRIKQLMRLYKRAYLSIGCFVLIVGSSLTPFINFFITGEVTVPNIHIIYLLYVINSGSSYFFSYKASYITANQKNYIVTNISLGTNIMIAISQLLVLFLVRNYIVYLSVQIVFTFLSNAVMSFIANKKFPILRENVEGKLDQTSKHLIIQNVSAAIFHKIGAVIVFSTDNILMSKVCGLVQVGLYSNYTLITKTLQSVISQFFSSISASVGNLCAEENEDRKLNIFYITEYINFIIYSFSSICIFEMLEEFICFWLGSNFLMEKSVLYLLSINYYLEGMRCTIQTFNGAMGLARFYKYMPIPESIVNLVTSIILGKILGPTGILIGTTISILTTCFWIEPLILYKYGFSTKQRKYYLIYLKYLLFTIIILAIVHLINYFINTNIAIINLILHLMICITIFVFGLWITSRKTNEFKYLITILNRLIRKK